MTLVSRRSLVLMLLAVPATLPVVAQSLSKDSPAPLHAGTNSAVIDSFGGNQFWQFNALPGTFTVTFTYGSPQEGFNTGGKPTAFVSFRPPLPGAATTSKEGPGTTTFTGKSPKGGIVKIGIVPAPGSLVRQTTPYTLTASGSVSFGTEAASGPSVVGVYAVKGGLTQHGIAKLNADGSVTTTAGEQGHWELFDASSRVYTISIGRDRYTLIFQPGRGFIDAGTQTIVFEMRK